MTDETTGALVADASRAHLFRVEVATGTWTPLETFDHPHGRHSLEADRFAKHVAAELARAYDQQRYRRLIVVAPPEFMGMLRPELPTRVAQAVIEERTHELSNVHAAEPAERTSAPLD
jgi:protein required for attachment to host cells